MGIVGSADDLTEWDMIQMLYGWSSQNPGGGLGGKINRILLIQTRFESVMIIVTVQAKNI